MERSTQALVDFIERSPSCFHVSENFRRMLTESGAIELSEGKVWSLQPGQTYFVRRDITSVVAFRVPTGKVLGFQCSAAHLDSPTYRLKGEMEMHSSHYTKLNVEKYGGMISSTWFDRPLSVAGRVVVEEDGALVSRLVNVDRDLLVIPHLAIHMNRASNTKEDFSIQNDLSPLFGDERAAGSFMDTVAETIGHKGEDILAFDLFLYARTPGTIWGPNREFVSCPRLDDLQCAFGTVQGFIEAGTTEHTLAVCTVFDNEEVGSHTKGGAASDLLTSTLLRIGDCLGMSYQEVRTCVANGLMVSADNAHAQHPNHPEKSDPTTYPLMNKGVVVKFHGGQKYATDSTSAALFRAVCKNAGVPSQIFANHSDMQSGGTLGNISTAQISFNTVDVGLAQLAMHSSYETGGTQDLDYLIAAMTEFFNSRIELTDAGVYRIIR